MIACMIRTRLWNQKLTETFILTNQKTSSRLWPTLHQKKVAKPVKVFDQKIKKLCQDMLYTMYQTPGIGLAAPQIGQSLRIFVLDVDYTREETSSEINSEKTYKFENLNPLIFINPIIKNKEGESLTKKGVLASQDFMKRSIGLKV